MFTPKSSRQWILANKPTDLPILSGPSPTFKLITTDLPLLQDDQVLVKTLYLSNDPAQRGWIAKNVDPARLYVPPVAEGACMSARGIAQVIESHSSRFSKGALISAFTGWAEYAVLNAKTCDPIQDIPRISPTHFLGALGMTGLTAYYGLKEIARATPNDTVVISGAGGAVGSMAVQIAKKLIGCKKVIAIAGSDDKCKWVVEALGADTCLNYKSPTFKPQLKQATEGFVEIYFDNVGGDTLNFMLGRMARNGRVAACGAIADYNTSSPIGLRNYFQVITMRLEIRGFIVLDFLREDEGRKAAEATRELIDAVKEGRITISDERNETVVSVGIEGVPGTWMRLFEGGNTGKLITKLTDRRSSPSL